MLEIQEKEINLNQMKILGKSCNILTSASWLFRNKINDNFAKNLKISLTVTATPYFFLSSRRSIFPEIVFGSSSTYSIIRGYL